MTDYRTVGDDIADAQAALDHAVGADAYEQLSAEEQAYLQEAAHFLTLVGN
ncbi:hypothetical protein ACFO0N_21510 [Halobium salinum]|uniref:Uncharacterized protein n=1 Tax=Halobium salinum TaxID=1364940 RepID=A0ABD5PIK1_9EURY|nr:hypothetical protein [Halobium salinum]